MDRGDHLWNLSVHILAAGSTSCRKSAAIGEQTPVRAHLGLSRVPARAGRALEPTVIAVHSQRVHAELNGWRTPGGIILREPVQASVEYTPALARHSTPMPHHTLYKTCFQDLPHWHGGY